MTEPNTAAFLYLVLFSLRPLGNGAAISPWPTTVTIMFLSTGRPLAKALAYLIGHSAVLVAIGIFALTVFGGGDYESGDGSSAGGDTLDVVFGILFLVLALKLW